MLVQSCEPVGVKLANMMSDVTYYKLYTAAHYALEYMLYSGYKTSLKVKLIFFKQPKITNYFFPHSFYVIYLDFFVSVMSEKLEYFHVNLHLLKSHINCIFMYEGPLTHQLISHRT